MGVRNYLIEGVSGAGKTSVATELERRGYHVIHGDRGFAYQGNPQTGEPLSAAVIAANAHDITFGHRHHIWPVDKVRAIIADHSQPVTFFCGGSRNFHHFIDLFDGVFVLQTDSETLKTRLAGRGDDEFGGKPDELALVLRVHASGEDIPQVATMIDSSAPLESVVDTILSHCM